MYIAPNSDIYFLKGVPLDKTYEHTIYFATREAQTGYFLSKTKDYNISQKYHLQNQSYQRMNPGVIRVNLSVEDLYDCNYIMYRNTGFPPSNGTAKYFYAFVKTINYVNNEVSEVEFEIDVIQTWYFDYDLQACFVEREHTTTDNFFEHTVEENLDIGDEYMCWYHQLYTLNPFQNGVDSQQNPLYPMAIAILVNRKSVDGVRLPGTFINGVYNGCGVIHTVNNGPIFANNTTYIDTVLDSYLEDEIVAVYQYPSIFWSATEFINPLEITVSNPGRVFGDWNDQSTQYTCRNRKLCSSPYTILQVSDNAGNVTDYKFELFKQGGSIDSVTFCVDGVAFSEPQVIIYPKNYKYIDYNYDEGMIMANFPVCCWAGDAFKSWWAQNKNSYQMGMLTNVVSGIAGVGISAAVGHMGGAISSGVGMVTNVYSMMAQKEDMKNRPNRTHGTAQTSTLNASNNRVRFDFYIMKIKPEYAKIIDEYFDKFGYACKRVKVPNRYARRYWTYTKTIGCTITETIPCDDAEKICNIYDSGITFWQLDYTGSSPFGDAHVADYTYYVNKAPNQPNPVLS